MAEREIGVGIVGYGLGGRVFPRAVCRRSPRTAFWPQSCSARATKPPRPIPKARIARSLDEMGGGQGDRAGCRHHAERHPLRAGQAALEAGKHVVIDKPFAATSEQALALSQLAKSKGLLAVPFHNRRWDGDFLTVKKLIAEQAVGRLVTFESHFDRFRPALRDGIWQEAEDPANGMLFDLGRNLVDQALALFGLPEAITASVRSDRDGSAIEDAFDITLSYPGRTAKGCWPIAGRAIWPVTIRQDSCCTGHAAAFASTGLIRRRLRWSAARSSLSSDRRTCGCRRASRRGAR